MRNAALVITGTAAAVLLAACAAIVAVSDREPPEIRIQPMDISYSADDDTDVLIQGISAYDAHDGDVTDSVLVKDVVTLNNGTRAKVVYVARDKSNNISEGYRIVDYEESDERLLIKLDDMYAQAPEDEAAQEENAEDLSEAEEPEEAEEISGEASEDTPEETAEEASGDEKEAEQPKTEEKKTEEKPAAKPADTDKTPKLTLKQSSITLKPGQTIDPMSLIKSKTNVNNVTVAGDVNLNIPGTYNMVYTATGTDGKTTTANLKIIVAQ